MFDGDISDFMEDAREGREDKKHENPLFQSEYNRIIMLCHQYSMAFIESGSSSINPMASLEVENRRNRIFQTIAMIAEHREELKTIDEYFGDREYGVFKGTIAEFEALEYVSYVQDRVMELQDWRVDVGQIDDEEDYKEDGDAI